MAMAAALLALLLALRGPTCASSCKEPARSLAGHGDGRQPALHEAFARRRSRILREDGAGSEAKIGPGVNLEGDYRAATLSDLIGNGTSLEEVAAGDYGRCGREALLHHSSGYNPDTMDNRSFLAVAQISEQLTKARLHFAELLVFAKKTSRTLILPTCGASHIAPGHEPAHSLCVYFDLHRIGKYVDWVTEDYFFRRILGPRPEKWTILMVSLRKQNSTCQRVLDASKPFARLARHALGTGKLKARSLQGQNRLCLFCPPFPGTETVATTISEIGRGFNILSFSKTSPHPCHGGPEHEVALRHVQYAKYLGDIVDKFVEQNLGRRFLAVHWRLEKAVLRQASRRHLMSCAESLIKTARGFTKELNLSHVFVASDITPQDLSWSDSLRLVRPLWRNWLLDAITLVHDRLQPVTWHISGAMEPALDSGIQGILDKLLCSRAQIFLFAPARCGGSRGFRITSSFTREILSLRSGRRFSDKSSQDWENGYDRRQRKSSLNSLKFGH